MEPAVRPYEPRDRAACRSLWAELTEHHRRLYADPTIGGEDPGSGFDSFLDEFGAGAIWVAELDGAVAGLAGLIRRGRKAEVEPVVVSSDYRRGGVGKTLVGAVVRVARDEGVEQVLVRPTARNADAIRFFRAAGFDAIARLELVVDLDPARGDRWTARGEAFAGRSFRS